MNRNLISLMLVCTIYQQLHANPTGFSKVAGQAKVPYTDKSGAMVVESGKRAVIEWDSFSVQTQETLRFAQKDKNSAVLNRVTGSDLSSILGTLTSNGKVFLVNPNGILIGENGLIQTAGFLASTANITNQEFMKALPLKLNQFTSGSIVNLGTIQASSGDVGLFARTVRNAGTLSAPEGSVHIGSAPQILLKPNEEQHLYISLEGDNDFVPTIENTGLIEALSVEIQSASSIYDKAISLGGRIDASKILQDGNRVFLKAENSRIEISGIIDNPGGYINIEGKDVHLTKTSKVDVSSSSGNAGKIDLNAINVCAYEGDVSGRALGETGDGGYLKLYGRTLYPNGSANFGAKNGNVGTVDLDPQDIFIVSGGPGISGNIAFCDAPIGGTTTVDNASLVTLLTTQNVILQAASDIIVGVNVVVPSGNTNDLSLFAGRSVVLSGGVTLDTQAGDLDIRINNAVPAPCTSDRLSGAALFRMGNTSSILSTTGSISVTTGLFGGSQQGAAFMDSATINSSDGNIFISMFGTPAGSPTSQASAVEITNGSLINVSGTTTPRSLQIFGTGSTDATQTSNAYGIHVNASSLTSGSNTSGIFLTGTGGGTSSGNTNYGVFVENGSTLQSSTLTVQILGTGGAGTSDGKGIVIDASSVFAPVITLTGLGGTSGGTNNSGLEISNIASSNISANIMNIFGQGGNNGTDKNFGVDIWNSTINFPADSEIDITGVADGSGDNNFGIFIERSSTISTIGTGPQTYIGTGSANGNDACFGIGVDSSTISTSNGLASFTGTAGGATNGHGIDVTSTSTIENLGSGGLTFVGTGGGTTGGHGISVTVTSIIETFGSGGLTFTGTGSTTGVNNNFGLELDNSTIRNLGASGPISITGMGNGTADNNSGCVLTSAASVASSGSGTITITGTGDSNLSGTSSNYGVLLSDTSTDISTNTSNINVTGFGNGRGDSNTGIIVQNGAQIASTSGSITLNGTGPITIVPPPAPSPAPQSPMSDNNGIEVTGVGSTISTTSNTITMTGTGGNAIIVPGSEGNNGILISSSGIVMNQNGNPINLTGHGGTGMDFNHGISLVTSGAVESNGASTITFNGDAQGSGDQNCGISINASNLITSNGILSLTGTGSTNGVNENNGIQILDASTQVQAGTGNITMNGTGGAGTAGVGDNNNGILMTDIIIHSTGTGVISLTGFGPPTPANSDNDGVTLSDCNLRTANGDIIISGTGKGTNDASFGTSVSLTTLETTGSGDIQISGIGASGLTNNVGIILNEGCILQTVNGNIQMAGHGHGSQFDNDGLYIAEGTSVTAIGSGSITILGTGASGTNGNVGLNSALGASFSTNSGNIQFQGTGNGTGNGNNGITLDQVQVSSISGPISLIGAGSTSSTTGGNKGVQVSGATQINVGTSGLSITGTGGSGGDENLGIHLLDSPTKISTATGNILLTGTGGLGANQNSGIRIVQGTVESTASGAISFVGTGNNDNSLSSPFNLNSGVIIDASAQINATGSGGVSMTGIGSPNGTNLNFGVGVGIATINSNYVINLSGTGNGSGFFNNGVLVGQGTINGQNTIYLTGVASATGTDNNSGVFVDNSTISTVGCSVNITGTGGNGNPSTNPAFIQQNGSSIFTNGRDINITGIQGDIIVEE